ncbi:unnamed protein product (macronuclear) [Paramecium tetraurelia]|uniref:Ubiquitin-like domain-containing protein n=1 Tax=Paramecium tetraurelia TaxID=5888 RepID=A0BRQ9_PARTE|nr:uncharacterized protein GSPATT00031457001 [Paramecium tetraurelia]CAK61226.1 unnamed protein product [Paramecium tetraurelia]|eukprot:XP_001428624.1 hypothetical protein (macronuclear) [Paramecium tetraurelia strain d4-2]
MELTIYSKQLDLKYNVNIRKSNKVKDIGLKLLHQFGYPKTTKFSIYNEDKLLESENLLEVYSLNKSSRLSIIFSNKFEITLIHNFFGNKEITIESWDQFTQIKHQIQREYEFSQSCEVCLRTSNQIYCLEFLIIHDNIHSATNIQWDAYEMLKYVYQNTQYEMKIDISDDWDMIAKQIKETQNIDKIIKIDFLVAQSNKSIDPTERYYQSKFSPDTIFEVTTPVEVTLQIAYLEAIMIINIKQTDTVRDLIKVAKDELNLQRYRPFEICYQGNRLQEDQNIQDLNLIWNSMLELRQEKIDSIQVQFKNQKYNQLIVKQVNSDQLLISVLKEIANVNCRNCTDFKVTINQNEVDQNQPFSELQISNNQVIEYECDAIEIKFIIGLKTIEYHAKKSHTIQSLEQEVKNRYQDIIPANFSIYNSNDTICTKTIEEMGLRFLNASFTFLPFGKFECEIQFDNKIEKVECFYYNTVEMLEQIIANKYQIEGKDIQSFYGYQPLNKDEKLKNIFVNDRFDIVMQKKEQIQLYLQSIDASKQQIVKINIDDPIGLALEREGLRNIKDIFFDNKIIDLNSNCQQLQIAPNSTLIFELLQ